MTVDPQSSRKPEGSGDEAAATPSGAVTRSPRAEALLGSAPDEQIGSAIAAEKWARAADLLELHGERLLLDEGTGGLSAWLEALPDEYVSRSAKLAALFAWVRIYDQRYQDALRCLSQAERALQQLRLGEVPLREAESDEVELRPFAELEQSLAAIRLHLLAVTGASDKLPGQVEEIMLPASGDHPLWRAGALLILGRSRFLAGDLRRAADDIETAHVLASSARGARGARVTAEAAVLLGRIAEARGRLDLATRRYQEVIADAHDVVAPARLAAEVGLARVALARLACAEAAGRLEAVRAAVEAAREAHEGMAAPEIDPVRVVLEGELARAGVLSVEGRFDDARAVLDQLDKTLAQEKLRWPLGLLGVQRARLSLLKKEDSGARRWLQQYAMRSEARQPPREPIAAAEKVTEALVQAALYAPKPALQAAREALAYAEETGHKQLQTEALVALSLAHFGAGSREDARSALIAALEAVRAMGGALLPIFVRGLDGVAAELGVEAEELGRAFVLMPQLPPQQPRERNERPLPRANGAGPIETSQLAEPPAVAPAEPAAAPEEEASAEERPAEPV